MRNQSLSNEVFYCVEFNTQIRKVLVRDFFRAVHSLIIVELEHDVSIRYTCRWQDCIGAFSTGNLRLVCLFQSEQLFSIAALNSRGERRALAT